MKALRRLFTVATSAVVLTACTAGQTTAPSISQVNPADPNYSHLELAVGTVNLYGVSNGLNVVSTLRQPNGVSALGVDTPTITGPFTLPNTPTPANGGQVPQQGSGAGLSDPFTSLFLVPTGSSTGPQNGGPALTETTGAPSISGTPQTVHPGTPPCDGTGNVPAGFTPCLPGISPNASTFGQSGGVFAMGIQPANTQSNGTSYSYVPYAQPIYDNGAGNPQFVPWGGPPAFDVNGNGIGWRDGLEHLDHDSFGLPYFLGLSEGINIFEGVTPSAGQYTLSIGIPILGNGGGVTIATLSTNATLGSTAILPTVTAPNVVPDGTGGATFTATLPPGVKEAYVQIVDFGPQSGPLAPANCQGAKGPTFAPVYYTVEVTSSGPVQLGNLHGPNTNLNGGIGGIQPSPTICSAAMNQTAVGNNTGDTFSVQMIGFDYPAYEIAQSLLRGGVQAPALTTNPGGQADITVSAPSLEVAPLYFPHRFRMHLLHGHPHPYI